MSFKYKIGCLVEAAKNNEVQIIAHQANCMNTMARGIAPLLCDAFPEVREADKRTMAGSKEKLGTYSMAVSLEYGTIIYNLYGQYDWRGRNNTNYRALASALGYMDKNIPAKSKIGLPKLGAGLGGGEWDVIEEILKNKLGDHDVTVYVLSGSEIPRNPLTE